MKSKSQLYRFSQFLLLYTLIVILWGAWVRISHSGDGCGSSWPLCNGELVPQAQQGKTWVEYSHRLTSGLFGILVIYLFWQCRKMTDLGKSLRRAVLATLFFMITEALLGAKLVLFGLVGVNDSPFRLLAMGLHQLNSLLLSGSVALVMIYAGDFPASSQSHPQSSTKTYLAKWGPAILVFVAAIAVTGAFASLSTTLFPSSSLLDGITKDFAPDSHYLLRIRILHPLLATLIGGGIALLFWLRYQEESEALLRKASLHVSLIFFVGVVFGYLTLFSLAPIWMKVVHLLLAHLIWITLLRWYVLKKTQPAHP